jgi:hypothetical protein
MAKKKQKPVETKAPQAPVPEPAPEPAAQPQRLAGGMKAAFWIILVFALFARFVTLDKASYTIDEINVIRDALSAKSLGAIWETELERFTQYHRLPMLMGIIRVCVKGMGEGDQGYPSESTARMPFALMGIASVVLFYFFGKALRGPRFGLWLMFLSAFSTFHVFYSRETYDYIMIIFFATGTSWAAAKLLQVWDREKRIDRNGAIGYVLFSTGLLHAHLSGLLYLGPWSVLVVWRLWSDKASRPLVKGPLGLLWLAILGAAFVTFLPFLFRVFGFTATEDLRARRVSFDIIPSILGRMGWGEGWYAILPFTGIVLAGIYLFVRGKDGGSRTVRFIALAAIAYFAIQTWSLRVSRFEVRYYSAIFPVLLLLAAGGLEALVDLLRRKVPFLRGPAPVLLVALPLAAWMGANAWQVTQLECRAQNYKGLARWVNENLPQNGIYSFWNGYEVRGVPTVYPTPGRFGTFPTYWSSDQDYASMQVKDRLTSFFLRFPLAAYVELGPEDKLGRTPNNEPIPRDTLFARQIWLTDPAYRKLVEWQTLPLGRAQWFTELMDHILVSYNKEEDLPALAAKQGRSVFHYFGNDWQYAKDQQMNDWLVSTQSGTFFLGNNQAQPIRVALTLDAMAPPSGCRISIYSAAGGKILDNETVPPNFKKITVPPFVLVPGKTQFSVEVLPAPGSLQPQLLLYGIKVEPASAQ